jgi:hypothetical protein
MGWSASAQNVPLDLRDLHRLQPRSLARTAKSILVALLRIAMRFGNGEMYAVPARDAAALATAFPRQANYDDDWRGRPSPSLWDVCSLSQDVRPARRLECPALQVLARQWTVSRELG